MRILLATLLTTLTAGFALAQAGGPQGPAQGPPPKNLTKHADGHVSANAVPVNTGDFDVHTVVAGDTLSGIAGVVLKDIKLWPQLWEQNEHIVNPHWIYPNDKILIRRVTRITDAVPPTAPPVTAGVDVAAPAPGEPRPPTRLYVTPYVSPTAATAASSFNLAPPRNFSEVKDSDLYCSGFIRPTAVSSDMKVTSIATPSPSLAAGEGNYVNLGKGTKDGIRTGATYQILRATRPVDSPSRRTGDKDLGMHYLEVAYVQVVTGQDASSLARVTYSCDAVEPGDLVLPYTRVQFPALPQRRPFSQTMTASGLMPGKIVMTKAVLLNFGSPFNKSPNLVGASEGPLGGLARGVAGDAGIVYVDIGKSSGAKPGDLFIVFRDVDTTDSALVTSGRKSGTRKIAIAEIVILRVEDRASTALVTYADDGVSLGDYVERR
jgi:hypothetical protein